MKTYTSNELRDAWKHFWESKNHMFLPEASLVGGKESTAMFNIAGMQQLIPYLAGKKHPLGDRLYNIQKCVRTVDIDEVGDASHHTFFQMMGNRSLGSYFKKEAVAWSREFLVEVLGFDPAKLAVTVFEGDSETPPDTETIEYWKQAGMAPERICTMPADNNWRSPGPVGPCGPDTEIFFWVGKENFPPVGSTPKTDDDHWLEIWNNVFMEFYRDDTGKLTKLANQNVDTGMGFERMCKVLQGKASNYETDLFWPLITLIAKHTGVSYETNERRFRIIADHIRTACFLIHDGVIPSNEGRGYVLRRLIRRMYYNLSFLVTISPDMFHDLLLALLTEINGMFEAVLEVNKIIVVLEKEATQFQKTITTGQRLLKQLFIDYKKTSIIPGADAFKLYDTCGFPLELTVELAKEEGFSIDIPGFEKAMEAQQQRSRQGSKEMFTQGIDWSPYVQGIPATKFVGYDSFAADAVLLKDFDVNGQRILIFDQTPLYAESGGQMSDFGSLVLETGEFVSINQVKKYEGVFLHFVA